MPGKQQNRLTHDKVLDINDEIRASICRVEGTEMWEYVDGVSDGSISVALKCQASAVANLRVKRYGYLSTERYRKDRGSKAKDIITRFETLEKRVTELELNAQGMNLQVNELHN